MVTLSSLAFEDNHYDMGRQKIETNQVVLRSVRYRYEANEYKFWIQYRGNEFREEQLTADDTVVIDIGGYICPKCHREVSSIDHSICTSCVDPQSAFRIRLSCMFGQTSSPLKEFGTCSKENYPCNLERNRKICHSLHVLYLGSIGNRIKVGVSRKNRRGSYKQRLYEQGLSQAIVIRDFSSRLEAMDAESWFSEMEFPSRMHFDDKIDALLETNCIDLQQVFPEQLLEERFPNKEIEYYRLHDPINLISISQGIFPIQGKIKHIQGPLLVINNGNDQVFDTRKLRNRVVRKFSINDEVII